MERTGSWMPVSPVTARLWALESMADTVSGRRRRLAPAVRRLAVAMTRRIIGGRSGATPGPREVERPRIAVTRRDGA